MGGCDTCVDETTGGRACGASAPAEHARAAAGRRVATRGRSCRPRPSGRRRGPAWRRGRTGSGRRPHPAALVLFAPRDAGCTGAGNPGAGGTTRRALRAECWIGGETGPERKTVNKPGGKNGDEAGIRTVPGRFSKWLMVRDFWLQVPCCQSLAVAWLFSRVFRGAQKSPGVLETFWGRLCDAKNAHRAAVNCGPPYYSTRPRGQR